MKSETRDYTLLHFLVLIWGFTAILGVVIDLPSVELVFFRTTISAFGLLVILLIKRETLRFRRNSDLIIALATGALIASHWILFFLAARISNVSVCLAGMATCSLWTSFMEPLANGRSIKPYEVILSVIGFLGILVIFNVEFDHFLGLMIAMLSAALAAFFTVINGKLTKRENPYTITFYEMIGAAIAIALFFPIYLQIDGIDSLSLSPTLSDWGYLLILSLVCTVFAYSNSVELMKRLSAFSVNLTVNLEPVYGITLALIFFPEKEQMTIGFYVGTALILASVLIYPILNRVYKRKALETDNLR